jgi:hypothetical protein
MNDEPISEKLITAALGVVMLVVLLIAGFIAGLFK